MSQPCFARRHALFFLLLAGSSLLPRPLLAFRGDGTAPRLEVETEPGQVRRADGGRAFERAYQAHHERDFDAAIAGWSEALSAGFRPGTSMYNLGCAHARKGETALAIDWLQRAIDAGFDVGDHLESDGDLASLRSDPRFQRLVATFGQGKAERAAARFERLSSGHHDDGDDGDDGEAWYELGMELHQAGDYQRAIRSWERSLALDHRAGASSYNIACAHALGGDRGRALPALERAVELGYGDSRSFERDPDLDSLRDHPGFRRIAESADLLDLPSGNWDSGWLRWAQKGVWQSALERYQGYLQEHPDSGRAWFNIGHAGLHLEDPAQAVTAFTRAHELGYRRPVSAYNVACAHARAGDRDAAFEWLERARRLGFEHDDLLATDPDLDSLRGDPRFPEHDSQPSTRWHRKLRHLLHD